MSFKFKPSKFKKMDEQCTLDETHRNAANKFKLSRANLDSLKKSLLNKNDELDKLNGKDHKTLSFEEIEKKAELKLDIENIKNKIEDIEHNTTELDYYTKTEDILLSYYDIIDDTNSNEKIHYTNIMNNKPEQKINRKHKRSRHSTSTQKSVLQYLAVPTEQNQSSECSIESKNIPRNRIYLHEQYSRLLNNGKTKRVHHTPKYCSKCNIERILIQSDGIYVCGKCGEAEDAIIESDIPNYKDCTTEKPVYAYKRGNHLSEWLNQFQAKEATDIPENVYNAIIKEINRSRIKNYKELTIPRMTTILKKLHLHQYYEHKVHLISKITGRPPPNLSREMEEEIKQMFKDIQEPFEKYRPKDRTNFLSYSYILHKFFQLLHMDDYVVYFPLLKNIEKIREHDTIWKKICHDMNWEFYPD